jgi:hypothetical protein
MTTASALTASAEIQNMPRLSRARQHRQHLFLMNAAVPGRIES